MSHSLIVDANSYCMGYMAVTQGQSPISCGMSLRENLKSYERIYGPRRVAVCFDPEGKCFRHDIYPDYKINRKPRGKEVQEELDNAWNQLVKSNYSCYMLPGFEADDVIATLCERWRKEEKVVIYSRDKDLNQLLETGRVTILKKANRRLKELVCVFFTAADLEREFHLRPDEWASYLALVGDGSDSWKGAEQIGKKAAWIYLREPEKLKPKQRKTIDAFDMDLALRITRLRTDVELEPVAVL